MNLGVKNASVQFGNLLKQLLGHKVMYTLILFALVLISLFSFQLTIIIFSIYLLYQVFVPYLDHRLFSSLIMRIFVLLFCYVSILQVLFLVAWLVYKETPMTVVPVLGLLAITIFWLSSGKSHKNSVSLKWQKKSLRYYAPVIVSLLFIFALVTPSLFKSGGSIISAVNGNVDDAAHISVLNDKLYSNRAITYHTTKNDNLRSYGQYPLQWHPVNAVFIKAFYPSIKPGTDMLFAYAISKIFWLFVLAVIFAEATYGIYSFFSSRKIEPSSFMWASFGILAFQFILLTDTYKEGFYSFIPQLIAAVISLLMLLQLSSKPKPSNSKQWAMSLLLFSIISIGGSLSWLLVLPAFALMVGLTVGLTIKEQGTKKTLFLFSGSYKQHIFVYLLLLVSLGAQLLIISGDSVVSVGNGFLNGIMLNGGITKYPEIFYCAFLVGFFTLFMFLKSRHSKSINYILAGLLSIAGFACLIYLLQVFTIGKTSYYFYKTLNIILIMVAPLSIIGVGYFISYIKKRYGNLTSMFVALSIPMTLLLLLGLNVASQPPAVARSSYLAGERITSSTVNNLVYKELLSSKYDDKHLTFFYTPGILDQNDLPTLLLKTNKPSSECFEAVRISIILHTEFDEFIKAAKAPCNDYSLEFITSKNNVLNYQSIVSDFKLSDKITIVGI